MRKLIYAFIITIITMFIISCDDNISVRNNTNELKELVREMNNDCPYSLGKYMIMESVVYNNKDVIITYTVADGVMNFEEMNDNSDIVHKNSLSNYANNQDEDFKLLIDLIIKTESYLNVVFNGETKGTFTMRFDAKELKNNRPGSIKDPELLIMNAYDADKMNMPFKMNDGLIFADVSLDYRYYTYIIMCDESIYDIEMLRENANLIKENIRKDLDKNSMLNEDFRNSLKTTNRGVAYKYIGTTSGKSLTICLEAEELID